MGGLPRRGLSLVELVEPRSRRFFFKFANGNRSSLASALSKMSPDRIAELLRLLADELESQPIVFKREYPGIVPVKPIRDFPHPRPIRDRGCWDRRGYDRCIRRCDDDECVDDCKKWYCRHY